MAKSTRRKKRKAGRPPTTGIGIPMVVRMHDPQIRKLDSWIRKQKDEDEPISRPEAIRRLINHALA
jgi:hypothetical protein